MTHDTNDLGADEWRSNIPPLDARAGRDGYDSALLEGAAIVILLGAAVGALGLWGVVSLVGWLSSLAG